MTTSIVYWPENLKPGQIVAAPSPMSRSGGRTLGGIERTIRSDRGYWAIALQQIALYDPATRRAWNALRSTLVGRAGFLVVPVYSRDTSPWVDDDGPAQSLVPHDDGTPLDDGALYASPKLQISMETLATIGATIVTLRRIEASPDLSGIRFSYNHALYETGNALTIDGDLWRVSVFPAIRATIPAGAILECDNPTCLVHLASDREMDGGLTRAGADKVAVNCVEAVDYWSDLANGLL
ncbi:hypothetical protein C3941_23805 [Kaistia algarum]|uniref:hypothetical protein n=1 Tax=Kaistia algarum TaxID=2083279 RepID=UPI000CE91B18|nr:hypothetical protein [Kaistia algarum]MCX5513417.1 hypothetical protein [Kaistia algarum]PPE77424.1 hypothetical protein C3941_23805 [Kaistia algarum]